MRILAPLVALLLVFAGESSVGAAPVAMSDLSWECSRRLNAADYGRDAKAGKRFLGRAHEAIQDLLYVEPKHLKGAWLRTLRSIPRTMRRLYPDEFEPGTPGDCSDLLDAYLPAATDFWRAVVEQRLQDLDGLLTLSQQCGHSGREAEMAKLRKIVARTRQAIGDADAIADPAERYDRMIVVEVLTLDQAEYRDLVPAQYAEESSIRARFGARPTSVSGPYYFDPWGEESSIGVDAALAGDTLTVVAYVSWDDVQFEMQRDIHWIYLLRVDVAGATTPGTHPVTGAVMHVENDVVLYHGGGTSREWDYTLLDGTFEVREACDDWIVGRFTVRMRSSDGREMTVRCDEVAAWLGG